MAYQYTDYSGYGDESDFETRKRRAMMLAGLPEGAGLADIAGQAVTNRFGQAQNNLAQAGQMFTNPEEELKKRMGVQGQPTGPVAPEQIAQAQPQAQQVPEQLPAQGPISPEMAQQPVQMTQLPQPGPATQVAGPAQVATQPSMAQLGAQAQQPVITPDQHNDLIIAARNETDPIKRRNMFAKIIADDQVSEGNKVLANRLYAEDYIKQEKIKAAERQLEEATPNDLSRYMREKNKEGSYLKAILFARLGLNDLAQKEQELINPTLKMESMYDPESGQRYNVEKNSQGQIVRAFTSNGATASQDAIAKLSSGIQLGKNVATSAETYLDDAGNRYQRQADERGNVRLVNIASGQTFTGDATKLKRQLDVSSMARVDYGLATDLLKKHSGNVLDMMKEYETIKGPMTPEGRVEFMTRYGYGSTLPSAQATTATGTTATGTMPQANVDQIRRLDGDIQSLNNEIKRIPANDPKRNERLNILNTELQRATQQRQQLGGAIQGLQGGRVGGAGTAGGGVGTSIAGLKQGQELSTAEQKERIQVAGQRSQAFNKILDEEVRPQAQAGDTVSSTRKQQFAIFDRPGVDMNKIFGLATGAGRSAGDQSWTMLRDVLLGRFEGKADDIKARAAALGLNPAEQSALAEYQIANVAVNAANLKKVAGAGSVSDAEQKVNREAGVDPTKVPALGAYNAMAQSQFDADKQRYKADWATTSTASNALQLDKDWRKESQRLTQIYTGIAKERADFIARNGSTTAAVKEGYKRYPIPEYDPESGTWKKTKPLSSFNR